MVRCSISGASVLNFYYLIELKGESRQALARKQAKEAVGLSCPRKS